MVSSDVQLKSKKSQVQYMFEEVQHRVIPASRILCVSSVGSPVYLHPTDCSQVRSASTAVGRSATGSRLPAAHAPSGFAMSWTCIAFMLLDYYTTMSLLHWLLLRGYSGSPPFYATLHVCSLRGNHFATTTKPQR